MVLPVTWASRYADFKLLSFEFFDSLQFYCGFLTLCTLYLYTTLLVIIHFFFFVTSITGNIALSFFYIFFYLDLVFCLHHGYLSFRYWFGCAVFFSYGRRRQVFLSLIRRCFTYAWFSLFYRVSVFCFLILLVGLTLGNFRINFLVL